MERIPKGIYTPEFRAEAVKLMEAERLSVGEAAKRLSISKSSLNNWDRQSWTGKLAEIGKGQRLPTEMEVELARMRKELAEVKLERDLLKKCAAYFAKEERSDGCRGEIWLDRGIATRACSCGDVPRAGCIGKWFLRLA